LNAVVAVLLTEEVTWPVNVPDKAQRDSLVVRYIYTTVIDCL